MLSKHWMEPVLTHKRDMRDGEFHRAGGRVDLGSHAKRPMVG